MSRRLKLEGLRAEVSALSALLKQAVEVGDPVGEYQLSKRRESLESEISNLMKEPVRTASVALFFGGKPVLGSRGISADFAGDALGQFQELISKAFAAHELGRMGERGPVPLKQLTNLMVTEIVKGSFGFVLDELQDQIEMFDTGLKITVEEVATLLQKTASPNDVEFEEAAETLDPRTLLALKNFFTTLDSSSATLRFVEDNFDFTLDETSVCRARRRTEATSIEESDETLTAVLVGFLPDHRKFEAKLEDGRIIYGGVAKDAADQYAEFSLSDTKIIGTKWKLKVQHRMVIPLNRPPREVNRLLEFLEIE